MKKEEPFCPGIWLGCPDKDRVRKLQRLLIRKIVPEAIRAHLPPSTDGLGLFSVLRQLELKDQ